MNTQAHAIINAVILKKLWKKDVSDSENNNEKDGVVFLWTIVGGILPDLPMFIFFIWYAILGTPQSQLWGELYFLDSWQLFFNLFNSIPLALVALFVGLRKSHLATVACSASVVLHCLADLLLHREDAHAHFLPFTDWTFMSPLSYWDPAYGGAFFGFVEAIVVTFLAVYLWRYLLSWKSKTVLIFACLSLWFGPLFWFVLL